MLKKVFVAIVNLIKRLFIAGLAAIIPIVITVYVIVGLFSFADSIIGKPLNNYLQDYIGFSIPGLGIVITILIIFIVGILAHITSKTLVRWAEKIFFGMPLVNKIYFPIKKIVDFLFFAPKKRFKSAVLVEYPRKGIFSLGFVTNESGTQFNERIGKTLYNVFISSSPSPLTGFTIIVPEEELIFLDMGVDEALKLVVSGGLLNPHE